MVKVSSIAVSLLSIVFVVLAPLVVFGYAAKPIMYEPEVIGSVLDKQCLGMSCILSQEGLSGNDIIAVSKRDTFSSFFSSALPQMLAYIRGDAERVTLLLKADEIKAALISTTRKNLETAIANAPACAADEQSLFVSMKEFTCQPQSVQDKEDVLNKAMSDAYPFLDLDSVEDLDLGNQITTALSGLDRVRNILKMGFNILPMATIVLVLLIAGIAAIYRKTPLNLSKTVGALLLWVGISAIVVSLVLPSILAASSSSMSGSNVMTGLVSGIFNVLMGNVQTYSIALIIIGAALLAVYYAKKERN